MGKWYKWPISVLGKLWAKQYNASRERWPSFQKTPVFQSKIKLQSWIFHYVNCKKQISKKKEKKWKKVSLQLPFFHLRSYLFYWTDSLKNTTKKGFLCLYFGESGDFDKIRSKWNPMIRQSSSESFSFPSLFLYNIENVRFLP